MKNTFRLIGFIALAAIIGLLMTACGGDDDCTTHNWNWSAYESGSGLRQCQNSGCNVTADIGDTGPEGGIIFYAAHSGYPAIYVKGYSDAPEGYENFNFDAYTAYYLEVAPANETTYGITEYRWSGASAPYYEFPEANAYDREIGSGRRNTLLILFAELETLDSYVASFNYFGGANNFGWFLPSIDELKFLYSKRAIVNMETSSSSAWYWSSTEEYEPYNNDFAWAIRFDSGWEQKQHKSLNSNYVRSVRAF